MSTGSGFVVGYALGSSSGHEDGKEEERIRQKKLSQMGKDRVLIKTELTAEKMLAVFKKLEYKVENNQIFFTDEGFRWSWFIGILIVGLIISGIGVIIVSDNNRYYDVGLEVKTLLHPWTLISLPVSIIISWIFGVCAGIGSKLPIDWEESKDGCLLEIQIYDDKGERNFSEIQLYNIYEAFGFESMLNKNENT